MKRLIRMFCVGLLLLPAAARAAAIEEGRHYQELPFPQAVETGAKIEVREFFWYGCPHCYSLEPVLSRWLKKLPKNAQFVRTPGTAPRWMTHAQAFYAFESLGVTAKVHEVFFGAVHEKRRALDNENAIADFIAEQGLSAKDFRQVFNSFGVSLRVERAKKLNQDLNIASVPTFVVDGRYLTSPGAAGGDEQMLKVLDFLIAKSARERPRR